MQKDYQSLFDWKLKDFRANRKVFKVLVETSEMFVKANDHAIAVLDYAQESIAFDIAMRLYDSSEL